MIITIIIVVIIIIIVIIIVIIWRQVLWHLCVWEEAELQRSKWVACLCRNRQTCNMFAFCVHMLVLLAVLIRLGAKLILLYV